MKKLICWPIFFLLLSLSAISQQATVKGTVLDENGKPLQGVNVVPKGSNSGTQTDAHGAFTLKVAKVPIELKFSFIGYGGKSVSANSTGDVKVSLVAEPKESEGDVVVIGYQSVKRKDLLASVSSVSAKDLKDIPLNSAAEALAGRLAGVQVTTAEGSPDADIKIRVRGGGSITQDNSPLYIIDGVQIENGLNTLSPQDIQSIDVLKDAAATAIYGARGANGVIIITTKSGKAGKLSVSYNGFIGFKKLVKELDVLDPYDFVVYNYERSRPNPDDIESFSKKYGTTWDTLSVYKNAEKIDWQKQVMGNTGVAQTHNVGVSGGGKSTSFNFSYTNNQEKAIVQNSDYNRNLLSLKIDQKIGKKIKIGVSGRYNNQQVTGAGTSDDKSNSYNRLRNSVKYSPFLLPGQSLDDLDPDPIEPGNGLALVNPIVLANQEYRKKSTQAYNFSANASWKITKHLSFKSTFGYNYNNYIDRNFADSVTPYAKQQGGGKPIIGLDTVNKKTLNNSNVLTWSKKDIKDKHDIDIILGEETYQLRTEGFSNLYKDIPTFTVPKTAFENASDFTPFATYPKQNKYEERSLSFFARVSYGYKNKYLFAANVRADGSSKFRQDLRWGYFPSSSFAWRVSKEKFFSKIKAISDFKIRLGYGEVGNNRIPDYLYIPTFNNNQYVYGFNGMSNPAYSSAGLVNELLIWETTVNRNIGVDVGFFKDRLTLAVDYYRNNTKDLLIETPIAGTYGYATQLQNVGTTSNRGVEFQLGATIIKKKSFSWNANFNIAFNKNRIDGISQYQQSFPAFSGFGVASQPTDYIVKVGEPVGAMYGLVTDGFYKVNDFDYDATTQKYTLKAGVVNSAAISGTIQPGMIKFKDLSGPGGKPDGIVDLSNDRTIIGDANPKFSGGLNQQFTYKAWDMSLFINFVYGNDIFNANKIEFSNGYTQNSNILAIMKDRWRTINDQGQVVTDPQELTALNANAKLWKPAEAGSAFTVHSWAIEDGSFLRINNLSIGYTLFSKALKKIFINKVRFYATANNLKVFTSYTGYDPEVNVKAKNPLTPGVDYSAYPKSRSILFGINASF